MSDDFEIIRETYLVMAKKDRSSLKKKMADKFGYSQRNFLHKIQGSVQLTKDEVTALKVELELTDRESSI